MRRRRLLDGMIATAGTAALTIALTIALGGAGCSLLPSQPYVQRRDWPLVVRRAPRESQVELPVESRVELPLELPQALPRRAGGSVLLVRTIQAGPGLETRGLQTVRQDGSVQTEFYEQWAVPPAEAVDDDLRRWLADSLLFAAVLAPGSRMTADLVLEGELVALHADLGTGMARAALALVLIDQRPGPARIRLQRTEAAAVKLEGTDPPARVRAQLAAVAAVLRQTEADLANALHP
jgi:ABC-type uncharacterized transport system auxiliary subunit